MGYYNKIDKIYKKYCENFNRKDETFGMMTVKGLVKELEVDKEYNNERFSEDDIKVICKYLYDKYDEWMDKRYIKLNSPEYKKSHPWC